MSLPTGTVSFLFTDIEGSTQRWEAGPEGMQVAVARHDALMRTASERHGGSVFKTMGDAFCIAFKRPADAVATALNAQRALAGEDFSSVDGLRVRMAIHTGTADERDGDYFGPTVNRVARLLTIGHGGQVLVSGTATDMLQGSMPAQTSMRDLGEHLLRDLSRPEQVYQLVAPGLPDTFPALRSLGALPNNLPRQPTSFIGRVNELSEIKALLAKSQVVTLVGTGGVGKTRAALQLGADLLDGSGDGVWFVDLAQVTAPDYVVPEIARIFNIQAQANRALLEDIRLYLKTKRLLLILDNCEHVVSEASRVVAALIKECPHVAILATSREGLNVHGEQVYRMPSLSVPAENGRLSADDALRYGAVALFVARAAAVDARFAFTDDKASIVADICRRLDGIALAIELAAARVTILSVSQLSQRLGERFRLLTGGDRAGLPRQQTMRAAIDWSYELLSEDEQTVFRRLSIFQGGWTLEAASAVCSDDSLDELAIFDHLSSLVNKSLVAVELSAETQRYRLLESLRQYGVECLKNRVEFEVTARRHALYFAEFGRREADKFHTIPELAWLASIDEELDNIRAALEWSLEQRNDPLLGAELAERLWGFWFSRLQQEGKRWIGAARQEIDAESHPVLSVALDLAMTRMLIGTAREETLVACERALSGARALGNEAVLARALFYYGEWLVLENRLDEAEPALKESLELAQRAGDRYRATAALQELGKLYMKSGKLDVARELLSQAMRYYEKGEVERNRGLALIDLASLERREGNLKRALELSREAQGIAHALRDRTLEMVAQSSLALYQIMSGRFDDARTTARSTLELSRQERLKFGISAAAEALAGVAIQQGEYDRAARLLGYAETSIPKYMARDAFLDVDLEWFLRPLRARFGDDRLANLMAEGAAWSEDRAVEEALTV